MPTTRGWAAVGAGSALAVLWVAIGERLLLAVAVFLIEIGYSDVIGAGGFIKSIGGSAGSGGLNSPFFHEFFLLRCIIIEFHVLDFFPNRR